MARVVATGGGGFTHGSDPALDDVLLASCVVARPRIGFIATASDDDPVKIARFHDRFSSVGCIPSHLPTATPLAEASAWVMRQHVIYVGGGNTARLLDHWRASGLDGVLADAARAGALLAGVSAGAVCWFEFALSDAGGDGLAPLAGLGLLRGSCCPHYSSEPGRLPAFSEAIGAGRLPDGIAIDDGVAVLLEPGSAPRALSTRAGCWAWSVTRAADGGVRRAALAALC